MKGKNLVIALFVTIFFSLSLTFVHGRSTLDVCKRIPIHTLAPKVDGDGGFKLSIKELKNNTGYKPNETYTVEINGTLINHKVFLGFMLIATKDDADSETKGVGKFLIPEIGRVQNGPGCDNSVVTHRYLIQKMGITVQWQAPEKGMGCIYFRTAVIETPGIWYKDDGDLTLKLCEAEPVSISAPLGDATVEGEQEKGCCACGGAKYTMHFQGLWTRQRHPKDFPTEEYQLVSMHWSRILGAIHSDDFTLWEYGKLASEGVKEICEFGHSNKILQEMKRNDKSIKTVIRTTPLWGEKQIRGSVDADIYADQHAHLMSLLSMVGPSPDWCVGVSKVDLCTTNCTWQNKMEIDLFPWDAGTDSGLSYFSRNIATNPKEPIRRITNRYPNHADSPFYGPQPILPMAKLILTKTQDLPCEDTSLGGNSAETAVSNSVLIARMKERMMIKKKIVDELEKMEKCATTEWGEWSDCDSGCGPGKRMRRRLLKNLAISATACNLELSEQEACQGHCRYPNAERTGPKELPDDHVVAHAPDQDLSDPCSMTEWSAWAPCSVTCGLGLTERRRMYINKGSTVRSCPWNNTVMQQDVCYGEIRDCRKAILMKNFSAICNQPVVVGPCRGSFQRWAYDLKSGSCMEFTYGGCRGNENNFRTSEECNMHCTSLMAGKNEVIPPSTENDIGTGGNDGQTNRTNRKTKKNRKNRRKFKNRKRKGGKGRKRWRNRQSDGPAVDCITTQWTEWSPCSVTCGKGMTVKTRMIIQQAENGGRRCPRRLKKTKKCRVSVKCPRDCVVSEWEEWSPCSQTCGNQSVQKRKRRIKIHPRRGGMDCPARREKRFCVLPKCPNEEMETMMRDQGYRSYFP